jgi:hypothetical protein
MNFFFISCHGNTTLNQYYTVPPSTIILFVGDSGEESSSRWPGQKTWLHPSEAEWEGIYRCLYGIEGGGNLDELVAYFRGRTDRQLYIPGDILPDTICSFKTDERLVLPTGVFELPLQAEGARDKLLLDLWLTDMNKQRGAPTWGVLYLANQGILFEEMYVRARFKSPEVEAQWRHAATRRVEEFPYQTPLTYFFHDPAPLLKYYDTLIHGHPSNLLRQSPINEDKATVLTEVLRNTTSTAPKRYRFFIATMCRTTYESSLFPRAAYIERPLYQIARRMSIAANREQCAIAGSPVLNLVAAWRALEGVRRIAGEAERIREPHKKLVAFVYAMLRGQTVSSEEFSEILDVTALPVQEDLPPESPARALLAAVSEAFYPLRRSLRALPANTGASVGQRLRTLTNVMGPSTQSRAALAAAAGNAEHAENIREQAQRERNTEEYSRRLADIETQLQGMIAHIEEEGATIPELHALGERVADFQQHLVNIEAITKGMSAAHYELVKPALDRAAAALHEFKILQEYERNYRIRSTHNAEFQEFQAIAARIRGALPSIQMLPPLAQIPQYQQLLREAYRKEEEIAMELHAHPDDRRAQLLQEEFQYVVLPVMRETHILHDKGLILQNVEYTMSQTRMLLDIMHQFRTQGILLFALIPSLQHMRITLSQIARTIETSAAFNQAERIAVVSQIAHIQTYLLQTIQYLESFMGGAAAQRRQKTRRATHRAKNWTRGSHFSRSSRRAKNWTRGSHFSRSSRRAKNWTRGSHFSRSSRRAKN